MLIDMHTHLFKPEHFIEDSFLEELEWGGGSRRNFLADYERHERECLTQVDKVVVFGIHAKASGVVVPNEYIAGYVKRHPDKVVGFACVDPNQPDADQELAYSVRELGLKGLKLGPIYQHFHPQDEKKAYPVYAMAEKLGLPILWHMGTSFVKKGLLEWTQPILVERIALDFPRLKMVIAHMGHPWEADTIVLIRKQPNVYADISALYYRPWQFYNTMVLALEYKVMNKILFGSDFPVTTAAQSIEGIKGIKRFFEGTALPQVPEAVLEEIVHRDSISILGIQ